MKRLILTTIMAMFLFSGCSLIPRITYDSKGATPQQTQKSKAKETCRGKAVMSEQGDMISCSKGYYSYEQNYAKKERKYTFKEKILNFFRGLVGWSFWIAIALVVFLPGTFGLVIGRFVEGTVGVAHNALKSVVTAVQRARKQDKPLDDALDGELDEKHKKYIRNMKEKEGIK